MTTLAPKAEALSKQFYSVFTKEDNNTLVISSPQYPNMTACIIFIATTNGIQKLLQDLQPGISGKLAGPDNMDFKGLCCSNSINPTDNI